MTGWTEQEFDAFVQARLAALVRFAYVLTGDLGHAEDLVQTALIGVYRRSRMWRPDDPERYVRRAVVNAHLSRFRRRRVVESLVATPPEVQSGGGVAEAGEQAEAVRELLARLSPRQRAVLGLRYGADLSEAETAQLLGVTVGTVKALASRGLARLRADLDRTAYERSAR